MILSELQTQIGKLLNDPNNTRWTPDVLLTRINLAQTEIQGLTNAVKTQETLTPVAAQSYLAVNANSMDIVRASKTLFNGSVKPFNGITREELDFRYPDWQQWIAGEPQLWWFDATLQRIYLVPAPDSTNAITNGITLWESRKPADLVNSTDIPFDSNVSMIPYHMSIVHWVVAYCWMDNGDPESLAKSKFHKSGNMLNPGQYENQIGRIMSEFDLPEDVPEQILWQPEGGRIGTLIFPNKSNPIPWQILLFCFGISSLMNKVVTWLA